MAKKKSKKAPSKPTSRLAATKEKRIKWLDDKTGAVLIESHARRLKSFMQAMADGRVDDSELKAQEARLVSIIKEVEPKLNDQIHARVSELLCELSAYDLMQVLNSFHNAKPARTKFRG
ncbi:MAG TPA: hypothetical protein VMT52_15135 [Planctomycetota bacterium]|nr:hypothetical protein [Planctomycetota bacterium]